MLCEVCTAMFAVELPEDEESHWPHHWTAHTFQAAVEAACYVCNTIWARLKPDEKAAVSALAARTAQPSSRVQPGPFPNSELGRGQGYVTAYVITEPDSLDFTLYFLVDRATIGLVPERPGDNTSLRAKCLLQPLQGSEPALTGDKTIHSTGGSDSMAVAKKWVATCVGEHKECNRLRAPGSWYPTRLLDCNAGSGTEPALRLVETSGAALQGDYMTLSHCWGDADCLKLTAESHDRFLSQIPAQLLPPLYRDAVLVTRTLGMRYLWIDSLCIVQGQADSADWAREVGKMDKVYSNSFCNISALDAADCRQSMFSKEPRRLLHPPIVDIRLNEEIFPVMVYNVDEWNDEVTDARLNRRAWVLQERLLSRRILHFGRDQIFWECMTKEPTETCRQGLPSKHIHLSGFRFKDLIRTRDSHPLSYDRSFDRRWPPEAYGRWRHIVDSYTACSLTFTEDKLAALSAVAKHIRMVLQDDYVCGMWRRHLEHELLWEIRKQARPIVAAATPTGIYRAPSWSWAATDYPVMASGGLVGDEMLIAVEEVHLDYSTEDETGQVKGGWLRLRGVLRRLQLLSKPGSRKATPDQVPTYEWIMLVDGVEVCLPGAQAARYARPWCTLDDPYKADWGSSEPDGSGGDLYCMPAKLSMRRTNRDWTYMLLLQRLAHHPHGAFRRIGLARGYGKTQMGQILGQRGEWMRDEYEKKMQSVVIV